MNNTRQNQLPKRNLAPVDAQINPNWIGYRCIACSKVFEHFTVLKGCPACEERGVPANLCCEYAPCDAIQNDAFDQLMPLPYKINASLGEGNTPLVKANPILSPMGNCWFKMELANPTGSHKDRMAAMAVLDAKLTGKHRVLAASSGNAGVAIAAYAALHGLACEIAITSDCPALYATRIQSYGARLTVCANSLARWQYLQAQSTRQDTAVLSNFALPAVGSPPVAIEGYKQIASELITQLSASLGSTNLGSIYVPVARGDLLWGLYLGFEYLRQTRQISALPRLVAVEPFARLSSVLLGANPHASFEGKSKQSSVAGSTSTFQSLLAIQKTSGTALVVDDERALTARNKLAKQGFLFELCAAAAWAAYEIEQVQANEQLGSEQQRHRAALQHVVVATASGVNDAHLFSNTNQFLEAV
jgi:threonine synthase